MAEQEGRAGPADAPTSPADEPPTEQVRWDGSLVLTTQDTDLDTVPPNNDANRNDGDVTLSLAYGRPRFALLRLKSTPTYEEGDHVAEAKVTVWRSVDG